MPTPTEDRPPVTHDVHTEDLPPLPQRHSLIPASRWVEAPPAVRHLGDELGVELVSYIRRIGPYLVWRAGRAAGEPARYCAVNVEDVADADDTWFFALDAEGEGEGLAPDGVAHRRFRSWKEALRDAAR